MRVSTIARVVRIPVFAAAVIAPMLVAACGNDPLAPTAQAPRASTSVDSAGRSGGSVPWFDAQTTGKSSGGSVPWFDAASAGKSGGSVPWF